MGSNPDAFFVSECLNNANQAMATHPKVSRVVEKNDTGFRFWADWRLQQTSDKPIAPARLQNQAAAKPIVFRGKLPLSFLHRTGTKIRRAGDDDPRGLAPGM